MSFMMKNCSLWTCGRTRIWGGEPELTKGAEIRFPATIADRYEQQVSVACHCATQSVVGLVKDTLRSVLFSPYRRTALALWLRVAFVANNNTQQDNPRRRNKRKTT
jgi:hypothetical protein